VAASVDESLLQQQQQRRRRRRHCRLVAKQQQPGVSDKLPRRYKPVAFG